MIDEEMLKVGRRAGKTRSLAEAKERIELIAQRLAETERATERLRMMADGRIQPFVLQQIDRFRDLAPDWSWTCAEAYGTGLPVIFGHGVIGAALSRAVRARYELTERWTLEEYVPASNTWRPIEWEVLL